jgi:hypothetical protein
MDVKDDREARRLEPKHGRRQQIPRDRLNDVLDKLAVPFRDRLPAFFRGSILNFETVLIPTARDDLRLGIDDLPPRRQRHFERADVVALHRDRANGKRLARIPQRAL